MRGVECQHQIEADVWVYVSAKQMPRKSSDGVVTLTFRDCCPATVPPVFHLSAIPVARLPSHRCIQPWWRFGKGHIVGMVVDRYRVGSPGYMLRRRTHDVTGIATHIDANADLARAVRHQTTRMAEQDVLTASASQELPRRR